MKNNRVDVVVAGHICLDIIPELSGSQTEVKDLFMPGRLAHVGPASLALGGAVANTGLALYQLGATTRLVGKLGDDLLGTTVLGFLRSRDRALADGIIIAPGESTSYTIVMSPPGVDRSFMHCPGANDTFSSQDFDLEILSNTRMVHFGYPPLMQGLLSDCGDGLANVFRHVQSQGALVSLDMTMPDISDPDNFVDWKSWLSNVLPSVDFFMPSFDEILWMLDPSQYERLADLAQGNNLAAIADLQLLERIAEELMEMGCPLIIIKLGDCGIYLQTHRQAGQQLAGRNAWQSFDWQAWEARRIWSPCFEVEVAGTTGAGDCTIAGVIMALLHGHAPEQALSHATAVGAWCVQSRDATSNIPSWSEVVEQMPHPWPLRQPVYHFDHWTRCPDTGSYTR